MLVLALPHHACPHGTAVFQPARECLPHGPGTTHARTKRRDSTLDLARLFGRGAVRLAIALKTAPLIQVKQCAAELGQRQRLVQASLSQHIGILRHQRFTGGRITRHQTGINERLHKAIASTQIAIASTPHLAWPPPFHRQR